MFKYSVSDLIVIPTTILVIIVGSIIYSKLTKNTKYNALPLKIFAVYLVLLEIAKQIIFTFYQFIFVHCLFRCSF